MKRELLIGCGSERSKRLTCDNTQTWSNVTTLDYNADHKPDVVWDLTNKLGLPFNANEFDEIHAYEVLEHTGSQGDYKFFFWQFSDFWRVLKPGGYLLATCPSKTSVWALGDPSHSRILVKENLVFLSQKAYEENVGKNSMSDFRNIYKANFEPAFVDEGPETFMFVLRAIK
jgi:hypothetical protein